MKKIVSKIAIPIIAAFIVFAGCNNKQHVMEKPDNLINRITPSIAYYVSEEKSADKLLSDASALIVSKKTELLASEMED